MTTLMQKLNRDQHQVVCAADADDSLGILAIGQLSVDTTLMLSEPFNFRDHTSCERFTTLGGSAAIVAHNASLLGGEATFSGHLGTEEQDQVSCEALERAGVTIGETIDDTLGLRICIIVETNGERTMVATTPEVHWSHLKRDFSDDQIVYFEGWHLHHEETRSEYRQLIADARDAGATVAVDLCGTSGDRHHGRQLWKVFSDCGADIIFANEIEADHYGVLSLIHI